MPRYWWRDAKSSNAARRVPTSANDFSNERNWEKASYLLFHPLCNHFVSRKPTRKMVMVPKTMARYSWMPLLPNEIQAMTRNPQTTPMAASMLRALRERNPSKNRPSIPPEKILESFHHESRMLSTFTKANAMRMPNTPMTKLERRRTRSPDLPDPPSCPSREGRGVDTLSAWHSSRLSTWLGISLPSLHGRGWGVGLWGESLL